MIARNFDLPITEMLRAAFDDAGPYPAVHKFDNITLENLDALAVKLIRRQHQRDQIPPILAPLHIIKKVLKIIVLIRVKHFRVEIVPGS